MEKVTPINFKIDGRDFFRQFFEFVTLHFDGKKILSNRPLCYSKTGQFKTKAYPPLCIKLFSVFSSPMTSVWSTLGSWQNLPSIWLSLFSTLKRFCVQSVHNLWFANHNHKPMSVFHGSQLTSWSLFEFQNNTEWKTCDLLILRDENKLILSLLSYVHFWVSFLYF